MALDESISDDYIQEVKDIKFVIDKSLKQRTGNISIDYRESFFGKGFSIQADSKECF